jgi:tetratricopeptide (TPR) repeat protein
MELYERALTFNPQHAEALYRLAEACGAEGQLHRALFLLEMCVHFCPTSADAFNALGLLFKVRLSIHCRESHQPMHTGTQPS